MSQAIVTKVPGLTNICDRTSHMPVMFVADMAALEKEVRSIVKDGLLWGSCKSAFLTQM